MRGHVVGGNLPRRSAARCDRRRSGCVHRAVRRVSSAERHRQRRRSSRRAATAGSDHVVIGGHGDRGRRLDGRGVRGRRVARHDDGDRWELVAHRRDRRRRSRAERRPPPTRPASRPSPASSWPSSTRRRRPCRSSPRPPRARASAARSRSPEPPMTAARSRSSRTAARAAPSASPTARGRRDFYGLADGARLTYTARATDFARNVSAFSAARTVQVGGAPAPQAPRRR